MTTLLSKCLVEPHLQSVMYFIFNFLSLFTSSVIIAFTTTVFPHNSDAFHPRLFKFVYYFCDPLLLATPFLRFTVYFGSWENYVNGTNDAISAKTHLLHVRT